MKKVFKTWKWLQILEGILLVLVGLLIAILIWVPKNAEAGTDISTTIHNIIGYVVAGTVLINGAVIMIFTLVAKPLKFDINYILGTILLALGSFITYLVNDKPEIISMIILITTAIFLFGIGIFLIVWGARKMSHKENSKLGPILAFVVAGLVITAGVLVLIFMNNRTLQNVAICIVGGLIAFLGFFALIEVITRTYRLKKLKKSMEDAYGKEEPIKGEVEVQDVIEEKVEVLEHTKEPEEKEENDDQIIDVEIEEDEDSEDSPEE